MLLMKRRDHPSLWNNESRVTCFVLAVKRRWRVSVRSPGRRSAGDVAARLEIPKEGPKVLRYMQRRSSVCRWATFLRNSFPPHPPPLTAAERIPIIFFHTCNYCSTFDAATAQIVRTHGCPESEGRLFRIISWISAC